MLEASLQIQYTGRQYQIPRNEYGQGHVTNFKFFWLHHILGIDDFARHFKFGMQTDHVMR